jgi:hypothetical protein
VLVAIPTNSDERWSFHPRAENAGSGLQGVIEGLKELRQNGNLPANFGGVAVFTARTTEPDEWELYDRFWHNGARP